MTSLLFGIMESNRKMVPTLFVCSMMITTSLCSTKSHNHHHHQPDYPTKDNHHQYISDGQNAVPDHRFFLNELFSKYGNNGYMTFEGFEHLLENLGLGGIVIKDHDVAAHKGEDNSFTDYHTNHNHSEIKSSHKREAPEVERKPKTTSDKRRYHSHSHESHTHHHHHSHGHHHKHTDYSKKSYTKTTESTTTTTEDPAELESDDENDHDSHEHDNEIIESDSVLYENLTSLVEDHNEVDAKKTVLAVKKQCLTATEILHTFNNPNGDPISPLSFLHLCPAIIYELDAENCADTFVHKHPTETENIVTADVWLYASLAILVISLCGLFSVAVIPIMQKVFYQTLLQFFVGMAVGSLSGDAMLHLLPHSLLAGSGEHSHGEETESESSDSEETAVFRGLAALGGIYFFFMAERLLNILTSYRRRHKGKKVSHKLLKLMKFPSEKKKTSKISVGEKLSQYKANSYENVKKEDPEALQKLNATTEKAGKPYKSQEITDKELEAYYSRSSVQQEMIILPDSTGQDAVYFKNADDGQSYVVPMTDHHGHGHGHSHEVPKSVSAVAWMVIMGDGLHNFCDGLAIGAAFASGIAGGLSTTVAVFCHELPHELGDFAMLLKSGMSVKQALMYNALSSILCFIGMTLGVALGNVTSATTWVFAGTAGMFLYIALVDMLPVLGSSPDEDGKNVSYLLAVQCLGIATGVTIMLIIAIYEHDLKLLMK